MRKRLGIISLFVVLFLTFIIIWNYSYHKGLEEAYVPLRKDKELPVIPSEIGVFQRAEHALDYTNMLVDENHQRTIVTYYSNRAYHGAPPSIPHKVSDVKSMGGNSCLKCHENGGFAEKFNAYTPVTPHPEMINCKQCHVPQVTHSLFKGTNFTKRAIPSVATNNALDGSPPVIPHQLQMRENCLSCHAGPAALKEIQVTHPERVNCRQCHVSNIKEVTDIGIFKRFAPNE